MILEGFEIENWSCIKRASVQDLLGSRVVVIHGPNGTGKTSIIEALRACLTDIKASSKALGRGFPKNSSDKPRVTVQFRARGQSWRVTKRFGTRQSTLECQMAEGGWRLETDDVKETHERTRELAGGSKSTLGLHQLLWLTQAEYQPYPIRRSSIQASSPSCERCLEILQTPLDDRFQRTARETWSTWFNARQKRGERPKLKKGCGLEEKLIQLQTCGGELAEHEEKYQASEQKLLKCRGLEIRGKDLERQHAARREIRDGLQREYNDSRARVEVHRGAVEALERARTDQAKAQGLAEKRANDRRRIEQMENEEVELGREVEELTARLRTAEERLRGYRREAQDEAELGRELQRRLEAVNDLIQRRGLERQRDALRQDLAAAEEAARVLEELRRAERERPAPSDSIWRSLEENRLNAARVQANINAATITLTLRLEASDARADLVIDGHPTELIGSSPTPEGVSHPVRRRAQVTVPSWGSIELERGSDARDLHQLEEELSRLDRHFAEAVEPFGITTHDSSALEHLRILVADRNARAPEISRRREELSRLAPKGLDVLRDDVASLENRVRAAEVSPVSVSEEGGIPSDDVGLTALSKRLKEEIEANRSVQERVEKQIRDAILQIDGIEPGGRNPKASAPCLRREESQARDRLTALAATLAACREQLNGEPGEEEIERLVQQGDEAIGKASRDLEASALSANEQTLEERFSASMDAVQAIENQEKTVSRELHELRGALTETEGLHQRRAAMATRVEELKHQTDRELLESDAYDRLLLLFEECREKQLGTLMGPIHDRVVRWMQLLRIGGYSRIRFGDNFLPEALVAEGGALELLLGEESTGTIEQIALMVRLALGSMLSTPEEPALAILDDPLTHSDVVRLDLMRAILRNATAGDLGSTPPAGPLQVLVFTCHPEWFDFDGATSVDLSRPDVLSRR